MKNPFKNAVAAVKGYLAFQKWKRSMERNPVLKSSYLTILEIFKEPFYSELSPEVRSEWMQELYDDIVENLQKPHPIVAMRERLCNYTRLLGRVTVVQVSPGHLKLPYVTGELSQHIDALLKASPDFAATVAELVRVYGVNPTNHDEIRDALGIRMRRYNLWTRVYTTAIYVAGDKCIGQWPKLYLVAQIAFEEYAYRATLKLPRNIEGIDPYAEGLGEFIMLGKLEEFILKGYEDPRGLWEAHWEQTLLSDCPYKGMQF